MSVLKNWKCQQPREAEWLDFVESLTCTVRPLLGKTLFFGRCAISDHPWSDGDS
jgi:hypothetical protein